MIVGILTAKFMERANLRDIAKTGKRMRIPVFVLPLEGIDLNSKTCMGYMWNGAWEKTVCPLPTVVYNRILTRKVEQRDDVQDLLKELQRRGIPLFNPGYFDKGELYRIIGNHPDTHDLLPETEHLSSPENLKLMLETHRQLYAKPVQSYAGKGILRIDYTPGGARVHSLTNGRQMVRLENFRTLYDKLSRNRRYKKYVLQRSVPLAKIDGHTYDLRVLVQKDRHGEWAVTGLGARVAPVYGIVTHVPNGGFIRGAEEALIASFDTRGHLILEDVKECALKLAKVIEGETSGILGEMSMDIGIDHSGKPWFFEANAKPGKFDEPEIQKLSVQRLLEFCRFLANNRSLAENRR